MNAVDATSRAEAHDDAEPPSLLTIILDTNPHAWALLEDSLPLSQAVANLLVFINAHLAINHSNRVAVLASHSERAEWLYPTPTAARPRDQATSDGHHGHDNDISMTDRDAEQPNGPAHAPADDANKYRAFARIEHALTTNLRHLITSTTPTELRAGAPTTMMAGALTMALAHIAKQSSSTLNPTGKSSTQFNYSDPSSVAGGNDLSASTDPARMAAAAGGPHARILVLAVSGDRASQYIPIMNAIFACQRLAVPIDVLRLAGDTVFLQQAADVTGGVYLSLQQDPPPQQSQQPSGRSQTSSARAGLLQYLMCAYLPDQTSRRNLIAPTGEGGEGGGVDFRAACFCHRRIVDIGFVCSICLSIFCSPLPDGNCLTCGTSLALGNYGRKPAVLPPPKKKKRT